MPSIKNIQTILPACSKAKFNGFGMRNDLRASSWAWTSLLRDVCPIMRQNFWQNDLGEWTDFGINEDADDDFFGRYGALNGIEDGKPLFTWTTLISSDPHLIIDGERPIHPSVDHHFIYLPMGWVKLAIEASEQGISRVTCTPHDTGEQTDHMRKRTAGHRLIGHRRNGEMFKVFPDGQGGFRYLPSY